MATPYVNAGMSAKTLQVNNKTLKVPAKPPVKPNIGKPAPKRVGIPDKPSQVGLGPKPADPYAHPQQYINKAVNRLGSPLTDAQIQSQAMGLLSPLVQALTSNIGRQAQAGTQAISGYTSELAKNLAPYQQNAANIYGGAQQAQAASDAALSAKLTGEGGQQAADLGSRLASINAPGATGAAVQDATQIAQGSGNALYATGSASLANLIASGAAEQSYAGKLPGIAGLAGVQQVGGLQSDLAKSLAEQTGQIESKVPDLVTGMQGQRSALLNRREALRQDLQGFFSDRAAKQQALKQERQALNLPDPSLSGKVGYVVDKQGNPVIGKDGTPHVLPGYHVTAAGTVAKDTKPKTKAAPTVSSDLSKAFGFLVDSNGNPILKNGQRQPLPNAPMTHKPLTDKEVRQAAVDAENLYHGVQHQTAAGQTVIDSYTQTYQDAIKTLSARYPKLGRKGVLALVNRWYKPGEYGRPAQQVKLPPKKTIKSKTGIGVTVSGY